VSCILSSHLPRHVELHASVESLESTCTSPPATMAFNITSDGSPTPRKGASRLNMAAGDLKIDTSPEVLDQVNGQSQNRLPIRLHSLGSSLTLSQQSQKRPLGMSTMGNISMPSARQQQQQSLGTFKVCRPFRI
jgi:hypothetical protein